jgi:hypothetical protein
MTLQITKWNFTCMYVKGFHMKLRLKFHMWKDFTWNYKLQWNFTCERISHEITSSGGAKPQKLGGGGFEG